MSIAIVRSTHQCIRGRITLLGRINVYNCHVQLPYVLILDFMKLDGVEQDFPDCLVRLPATFCSTSVHWLHFQLVELINSEEEFKQA